MKQLTFNDYYNAKLSNIKKYAKRDKLSVEDYLKKNYHKTIPEYKKWKRSFYDAKGCHSFWHRECVNKGIECNKCLKHYSQAEWDKMNKKEQNYILNN